MSGDDNLGYEEYVYFYMRLVYAFNHDEGDDNDMDAEQTLTALAVDWANDSLGDGDVDYEDFLDSVFELARKWAEDEGESVRPPNGHGSRCAPATRLSHAAAIACVHARAHALAQTETGTSTRTIWCCICRTFTSASSVRIWAQCRLGGTGTSPPEFLRTGDCNQSRRSNIGR